MRPFYELQIGHSFARFPEFFGVFCSCNRGGTASSWCGTCAKCISVFITTYPFVSKDDLFTIFGSDYFDDPSCVHILQSLAGLAGPKPFECVTTKRETLASLALCVDRATAEHGTLPPGLEFTRDHILKAFPAADRLVTSILAAKPGRNLLPERLSAILSREVLS
jgi:hypothetical protein